MMIKIVWCLCSLLGFTVCGFAGELILDNQTAYPKHDLRSKTVIQWASSAHEVDEANKSVIHKTPLNTKMLQAITRQGVIHVTIPTHAHYFRVLVWTENEESPDLLTNWVDIIPNKTYALENDHLIPSLLMLGSGC